jgi:23S rRNA pseudouridine2605 synthase
VNERLHKLLAQHGLGSRRQVEDWIRAGRVLVNGRPAEIGQRLQSGDKVVVDGRDVTRLLSVPQRLRVIVYHKPTGEMLRRHEGDDREDIEAQLPKLHAGRWVAVNALGYGEDGLLILTNDGPFASAIARRGHELAVEYRVRALKPTLEEPWPEMPLAVEMEGGTVNFSAVESAGTEALNMWFRVAAERTVPRGAVRALFDSAGLKVSRVMLVQWGPMKLPRDLPRSRSRELEGPELDALMELAGRSAAKADKEKPRRPRSARRPGAKPGRRSGNR